MKQPLDTKRRDATLITYALGMIDGLVCVFFRELVNSTSNAAPWGLAGLLTFMAVLNVIGIAVAVNILRRKS